MASRGTAHQWRSSAAVATVAAAAAAETAAATATAAEMAAAKAILCWRWWPTVPGVFGLSWHPEVAHAVPGAAGASWSSHTTT